MFTVGSAASFWIFQINFPRGKKNATKLCLFWYYFLLSVYLSVEPRKKGWWMKNQRWGWTRNTTAEFCIWWWEWNRALFRNCTCCFGDKPSVTDDCPGKIHSIFVSVWYLCSTLLLWWQQLPWQQWMTEWLSLVRRKVTKLFLEFFVAKGFVITGLYCKAHCELTMA